jgi:hypothetical protein
MRLNLLLTTIASLLFSSTTVLSNPLPDQDVGLLDGRQVGAPGGGPGAGAAYEVCGCEGGQISVCMPGGTRRCRCTSYGNLVCDTDLQDCKNKRCGCCR